MFFTTTLTCFGGQCIEHFEGDVEEVITGETVYDEMSLARMKQSPLMSTMNRLQTESFAPSNESARRTEVSSRLGQSGESVKKKSIQQTTGYNMELKSDVTRLVSLPMNLGCATRLAMFPSAST